MPSELVLIDAFLAEFGPARPGASRARVGPGDDCAVLPAGRGDLCVTTDAVVEGVHFLIPGFSWEDVGHKALAVNLSDLAAMGAAPDWFVCALGCPRGLGLAAVRGLARGMAALARRHGAELVGGNFTAARELSVTVTAAGRVPPGEALLRRGARPGDVLYVSGRLGGARLGLAALRRELPHGTGGLREALRRQRRPEPRVALGRLARRFAHAGMDLSDGLAGDLAHLCARSGVGAEVELARLPQAPGLTRLAARFPPARAWALEGGEDYELLLAVPAARVRPFERACARAGEPVQAVGRVVRSGGARLVDERGRARPFGDGFDHFRGGS